MEKIYLVKAYTGNVEYENTWNARAFKKLNEAEILRDKLNTLLKDYKIYKTPSSLLDSNEKGVFMQELKRWLGDEAENICFDGDAHFFVETLKVY